jgi:hypothetical protein
MSSYYLIFCDPRLGVVCESTPSRSFQFSLRPECLPLSVLSFEVAHTILFIGKAMRVLHQPPVKHVNNNDVAEIAETTGADTTGTTSLFYCLVHSHVFSFIVVAVVFAVICLFLFLVCLFFQILRPCGLFCFQLQPWCRRKTCLQLRNCCKACAISLLPNPSWCSKRSCKSITARRRICGI